MRNKVISALFMAAAVIVFLSWQKNLAGEPSPAPQGTDKVSASENKALEETLIALEKKSWEAWQKRDGKFYQEFLSEDHLEVGAGGVDGKASIVGFVGSPACTVKSYSVDKFKCTLIDPNVAALTYYAEQDTVCRAQVPSPAWVTSVYVKRGDRWLNVLYQQTPVKK